MSATERSYGMAEYWDSRYKREETKEFDWYFDWEEYFEENIGKLGICSPVLVVGCGNSVMSKKMEECGIAPIVSMDISRVVCHTMAERTGGCYVPMDVCAMQFRDESFDCVIDKGTLDAVLCGQGYAENVTKMMKEIARVLTVGGTFLEITFGDAAERLKLLDCPELLPWKLECVHEVVVETGNTFIYVLRKSHKFVDTGSGKLLHLYEEEEDESDVSI